MNYSQLLYYSDNHDGLSRSSNNILFLVSECVSNYSSSIQSPVILTLAT